MEADIIITITLVTGFVLVVSHVTRIIRARMLQRTIRDAIQKDSSLTPALLDRMDEQQPTGAGDDRIGLVLLALGAALFCYGLIQGDADDIRNLSGIALFPVFVGATLLGRIWFIRRRGEVR